MKLGEVYELPFPVVAFFSTIWKFCPDAPMPDVAVMAALEPNCSDPPMLTVAVVSMATVTWSNTLAPW